MVSYQSWISMGEWDIEAIWVRLMCGLYGSLFGRRQSPAVPTFFGACSATTCILAEIDTGNVPKRLSSSLHLLAVWNSLGALHLIHARRRFFPRAFHGDRETAFLTEAIISDSLALWGRMTVRGNG